MSGSDTESYVRNRLRAAELEARRQRIQQLNDDLRRTFTGGLVTITSGIQELEPLLVRNILAAIQRYDQFEPDDDPYAEHDFGCVTKSGYRIYFKIDYYGVDLECGSPDPSDPCLTTRVLTIMLASEY